TPELQQISVLDVYQNPTIAALAAAIRERHQDTKDSRASLPRHSTLDTRHSVLRHFLCGTAQLISLIFVLSFFALQWLAPYLTYTLMMDHLLQQEALSQVYDVLLSLLTALASLVVLYPIMLLVPILVKWIV